MKNPRRYASIVIAMVMVAKIIYSAAHAQDGAMMCTQMWCSEGMTLEFTASQWPQGQYRIDVVADDERANCTAQLPLPPCAQQNAFTCSNNTLGLSVITVGCAMPQAAHALGGLMMTKIPKNIEVSVTMPDSSKREMSSLVESHCGYPNGEQCDKKPCCSAKMAFSLDK